MEEKLSNKFRLSMVFALILSSFFLFASPFYSNNKIYAQEENDSVNTNNSNNHIEIEAESALVVDLDNGQILLDQNTDKPNEIASLTKMITQYIVFQEIESGNLSWDDEIEISEFVNVLSLQPGLANVPLRSGATYTVEELFNAMSIYSANAATVAFAEHIEGSEAKFVDRMRTLLDSWGVNSSEIYNSTGLNNGSLLGNHYPGSSEEDENQLTAKEVAVVALNLLNDYPEILETSSIPVELFSPGTTEETEMINWNWMLEGLPFEREGVVGLKTGTTSRSGANFVGVSEEGDRRVLTVIMNAGDGLENRSQRFVETDRMMDYGFNEWNYEEIIQENTPLEQFSPIEVRNGLEESVNLIAGASLELLIRDQASEENLSIEYEIFDRATDDQGKLIAPFDEGAEVGTISVSFNEETEFIDTEEYSSSGETVNFESIRIPLVTEQSVEEVGLFSRIGNWFKNLFERIA